MTSLTSTKYQSNKGGIYLIKLTPDFAASAGTPPTGAINRDVNVKVSKNSREYGLKPRGVSLARTVGTAPDTFRKYSFLPALTPEALASAALAKGATVSIGGTDWTVVAQREEDFN